jgi:hypothetical protein
MSAASSEEETSHMTEKKRPKRVMVIKKHLSRIIYTMIHHKPRIYVVKHTGRA